MKAITSMIASSDGSTFFQGSSMKEGNSLSNWVMKIDQVLTLVVDLD